MTFGTNKELHRYPRGFKKKLTEYYGLPKPMCVLCWSQMKVAIHHHIDMINEDKPIEERNSYYYQLTNNIDWSDLSKFVLLCGSCHSKVERMLSHTGHIDRQRPPMLVLLNEIIEKSKGKVKEE